MTTVKALEDIGASCSNCRMWRPEDGEKWGHCRIQPYAQIVTDSDGDSGVWTFWAQTDPDEWCAQHKASQ